jgi:predicted NBD/HSP70 family sugar kinase
MSVKSAGKTLAPGEAARARAFASGVNSAWVRKVNAALLMRALRRNRGSSQRELAALTGLDKATVSAVTSQLAEAGLIARSRATATTRRLGRPAVALEIPLSAGIVYGVRLEPDRIAVLATDLGGQVVDRESRPGSPDPREAVRSLKAALAAIRERVGNVPQRAIGIGVPALIDRRGQLVFGPNLRWRDVPLAEETTKLLPAPVVIENDTNAAAIAEREFGSCAAVDDFLYISGHSGVGGAVFAGGELYRGANGLAGEIGHIRVAPDGRTCACGGRGCLEAYASEPALLSILASRGARVENLAAVAAAAGKGDSTVLMVLHETGTLIGRAVSALVNTLNPSRLVLGGNLAIVAPWMLPALKQELGQSVLPQLGQPLQIELSPLGADAVLMGGIALALQKVDAELLEMPASAK